VILGAGNKPVIRKAAGKIRVLEGILKKKPLLGNAGIAHTRWATHGAPNEINAHPHADCTGDLVVVHNGIIENYEQLKARLIKEGHRFRSQTDTEVIVHLIESLYRRGPLEDAVRKALARLEGSFAVGVISKNDPGKIIGARLGSPLVVGLGRCENFLASDAPAILDATKDVVFLEDNDMAVLTEDRVTVMNLAGKRVVRSPVRIGWDISQAQKQGWPHFMLKEINEQPQVLSNMLAHRALKERPGVAFEELKISPRVLSAARNIVVIACGTAYHAGMCGKYILEKVCRVPVTTDLSSEFRYRDPLIGGDLAIAVSHRARRRIRWRRRARPGEKGRRSWRSAMC
jgi:glucosamine--fructose-6-phosphate aminotransferase (isomerizing)